MILLLRFALLLIILLASLGNTARSESDYEPLGEKELRGLEACEGVIELFRQVGDSIWPGYDLARRPFMFYVPEKWALLFNYHGDVEGFTEYPADWPPFNTRVLYHQGQYQNLAGQLLFGAVIDTMKVVAVNWIDRPARDIFAYIAHENFHQFQRYDINRAFGEIPWAREEKYPIEDAENTALAVLEMRLLEKALLAANSAESDECITRLRQFIAVRDHRWNNMDPFIARYEQGQEINEGTAEYCEKKALSMLAGITYESSLGDLTGTLADDMTSFSIANHVQSEFAEKTTDGSISPEDVARNRIYPVGSTQGLLLDYLGVSWKESAQRAGTEFSFVGHFKEKLQIEDTDLAALLEKAKAELGYDEILSATNRLIAAYRGGFESERTSFENQEGTRVEISLSSSGLRRSRSSSARKWLMNDGGLELRQHYSIYSLTADDLLLQVHESGLLENNDWDKRIRSVAFFVGEIDAMVVDGRHVDSSSIDNVQFRTLELAAENLKFSSTRQGSLRMEDRRIIIDLL